MRRNLWGICLAFGVAILALVSVRAEEEQIGTPPSIVAGQEEQYGTAHPASADGAIPAVPYRANVSDWFESDTEMTYHYTGILPNGKMFQLNSETGELLYEPLVYISGNKITFYVYATNQFGRSDKVKVSVQVGKTMDALNAELNIRVDYYPSAFSNPPAPTSKPTIDTVYPIKVNNMAFWAEVKGNGNLLRHIYLDDKRIGPDELGGRYSRKPYDIKIRENACAGLEPGVHTVTIIMSGGEDLSFPVTILEKTEPQHPYTVTILGLGAPDYPTNLNSPDYNEMQDFLFVDQIEPVYRGETLSLPEYQDTKYYRFAGWWSETENPADSERYTAQTPIMHDVGLKTKWELIQYTVHFLTNKESIYNETINLPDEKIELPPEPERKGYQFMGWYTKPNGQGEPLTDDTVVAGDTDYYAHWKKIRVSGGGKSNYVSWGAKVQEQNNTDTEKLEVPTEEPPISAKKESIMNGYSDGTFRPEQTLSGADAEKVLKRIAAEESLLTDDKIPFENIFKNRTVTRGAFCAALAKALNILPAESSAVTFGDLHNDTNKEYICALVDMGIIKGYGDDTFRPGQLITRAESAAMINRALKRTDSQPAVESKFSDVFPTDWYYADVMNVCAYME